MNSKINYFVTRFSFLGVAYHLLFRNGGHDAWISIILGTMLGIGIIYLLDLVKRYAKRESFLYRFIYSFINIYFIIIAFCILPLFVTSFYLINTPVIFLSIPFLLICFYTVKKGRYILYNLSNLLFGLSLIFILIAAVSLINHMDLSSFLPILEISNHDLIKTTLFYTAMSSIPNVLSIHHNIDFKVILKNYLFSSLIIFMVGFITTACIGSPLISIYSFPEYVVLKRITLLDFIENIENILSILWYCDIYFVVSLAIFNLKEMITNKFIYYSSVLLPFFITTLVLSQNYVIILHLLELYPYVITIFLLIFLIYNLFNKKKNTNCS